MKLTTFNYSRFQLEHVSTADIHESDSGYYIYMSGKKSRLSILQNNVAIHQCSSLQLGATGSAGVKDKLK